MLADPLRGYRIVARTASAYLTGSRKNAGRFSPPSSAIPPGWTRCRMTVDLALLPDRLRAYLGFVRRFIGLALDAMTATQLKPAHPSRFLP
jgi:hypothetical protein